MAKEKEAKFVVLDQYKSNCIRKHFIVRQACSRRLRLSIQLLSADVQLQSAIMETHVIKYKIQKDANSAIYVLEREDGSIFS